MFRAIAEMRLSYVIYCCGADTLDEFADED